MSKFCAILIAVFTLFFTVGSNAAYSQGRPDSRNMTCDQAYALVRRYGAVVMSTGRYTFERVVANRSWCQRGERLRRYSVPTLDVRHCRVGYKCVQDDKLR